MRNWRERGVRSWRERGVRSWRELARGEEGKNSIMERKGEKLEGQGGKMKKKTK